MFEGENQLQGYPIKKNEYRKMTDLTCFIIYLVLTFLLLGTFFYSFILQKQKNLFIPEDPDGRRCGEGEAKDYPFIFFPVPFVETMQISVCVSECPTDENTKLNCLKNSLVKKCQYDVTDHFNRQNQFIVYKTEENQFLRLCRPDKSVLMSSLNSKINTQSLFANFERIMDAKWVIMVVCPVVCLALILVYVMIVNCCKDIQYVMWAIFACFIIICLFIGIYLMTDNAKRLFGYFPIIGGIIIVMTIGIVIYVLYDRERIKKSIELLNFASIYIRENPLLIFISLGSFIVWALIFALQLVIFIGIYSINEGEPTQQKNNSFAFFTSVQNNTFVNILLGLTVFHYIWTNLLIYHTSKYLTKALASNWVLRIQNPFKLAIYSMLRFHTGTIVFGSIVLTFFSWLTDFFYFIMPGKKGRTCCCRLQCLVNFYSKEDGCFRRFLGLFTQMTYIRVNLEGEDFCEAGQKLSPMLVENLIYINRAYRMANILIFTSKILIAFITSLICFAIIELDPNLSGHIIINIVIFIFSLVLTGFATDSYDRSFETILITILINEEHKKKMRETGGGLMILAVKDVAEDNEKKNVYTKILEWFEKEKEEEMKSEESIKNQNAEENKENV